VFLFVVLSLCLFSVSEYREIICLHFVRISRDHEFNTITTMTAEPQSFEFEFGSWSARQPGINEVKIYGHVNFNFGDK